MIQSDKGLAVVQEQLGRAERALASLRASVKNDRTFAIYSEGYVDQIAELKADIGSYLAAKRKNGAAKKKPSANGKRRRSARKPQKT
jgi:hypothetical protein